MTLLDESHDNEYLVSVLPDKLLHCPEHEYRSDKLDAVRLRDLMRGQGHNAAIFLVMPNGSLLLVK